VVCAAWCALPPAPRRLMIKEMNASPWQQRIKRAEHLARQYSFVTEILRFYAEIARFQEDFYRRLEAAADPPVASGKQSFGPPESPELMASFGPFLAVVEKLGPAQLARLARDLQQSSAESWSELLIACWGATESFPALPEEFLACAFFFSPMPNSCAAVSLRNRTGTSISVARFAIASRAWACSASRGRSTLIVDVFILSSRMGVSTRDVSRLRGGEQRKFAGV